MSGDRSSGIFFSIEDDAASLENKIEDQGYRDRLDAIVEGKGTEASGKIQAILRLGAEWLGVENGHLTEIDPAAGTHTIALAGGEDPAIGPGDTTDLSNTYCRMVIAQNNALGITNAPEQGFAEDSAYQARGLSTYFGAKVVVSGELYGTACFVDREPRPEPLGEADAAALALLVRSIEQVLGQTRGDQPHALQQSRRRFEALLNDPHILAGILAPDGTLLESNETALEYIGAGEEEVDGTPFWETPWWPGEMRPVIQEKVREAAEGTYVEYEADLTKPNGEPYSVSGAIRPVRSETGDVILLVVTARDITERKRREEELRQRKALLKQTQKLAGAWEVDLRTEEIHRSEETRRIHEMDPEAERTLEEAFEVYAPEAQPKLEEAFRRCIEEEKPYDLELPLDTAKGNRRWVRAVGAPAKKEDGEIVKVAGALQDITEQKETEHELRRQKALLEQTQRLTGAWMADFRTGEVSWSEEGYRIHELDPSVELSLEKGFEFLHPESFPEVREAFERCVEAGEPYDLEHSIITAEGNRRWVRTVGAAVEVKGGEVVKVAGAFQDITEQKEAKKKLRKSRERLQMAIEGGNIGTWDWDLETGEVMFNRQWAEMLGYSREELDFHFRTWEDLVHPEDLERAMDVLDRYIAGETDTYDPEIRMRTKSGEWTWIQTIGKVVDRNEVGEITRAAGIHLDIDERKRAEEALQKQEAQFRGLANSIPGVVYQFFARPDGTYGMHFVGEQAEDVLGISADEEGFFKRFVEQVPEPHRESFLASIDKVVEEETSRHQEVPFDRPDGERIWLLATSTPEQRGEELAFNGVLLDITDRKEAERRLERQNDLFERAQEIAEVGAWEYDVKADEGTWTRKAYTILEYPLDADPNPRNAVDFYHPEDQPRVRDALRRALEEGESSDLEVRVGSGEEVRWVRIRGEPQREHGEVVRIRGTIQDITKRKERERALRELKSRYQTLVDNFPEGAVYLFDEDLTYQLAGGQRLSKVDLSVEEVVGSTLHDLFPEDVADRHAQYYHRTLDGEKCVFEETYQGRRYRVQTVPVRGEDGKVTAGLAVAQDTSERWLQQKKLERRKAKVRALYETVDRLFRASSPEEVGEALIEVIREALGHEGVSVRFAREDQLVATHVAESTFEFMPERPDFAIDEESVVAEIYRAGETLRIEDLDTSDLEPTYDLGDLRSVIVVPMEEYGLFAVSSPEPGAIGEFDTNLIEVLAGYATLVLGRLEREKSLREAKEAAESANRLKSAFLATMSHEIRTPLTSIIGFAEAIEEEAASLDPPVRAADLEPLGQFAGLIQRSGQRLMKTLTGVLNLSKLEAGEMDLAAEPVDLAEQAAEIAEELRPQAEEKGLTLQVETGEEPAQAQADIGGVQIVLRNLIKNAIKYTEEGEVRVRAYQSGDDEVPVLEVEDTGIGMDPEEAEGLFEPFRQESEGLGREYEGTGLGLAVTKRTTEQMGGRIEVETEKGKGSCFTVRLPTGQAGDSS